jgi:hypothetical protein
MNNLDLGYLLMDDGKEPEVVKVKHHYLDNWSAWYDGKWRKVYIQVNRTYIVYNKNKITIHIEGV